MLKKTIIPLCFAVLLIILGGACDKDPVQPQPTPTPSAKEGIYLGVIGFNNQLYVKDITLLNSSTYQKFNDFISNLTPGNGTALFYADYTALKKLRTYPAPPELKNVALVTFTDGLDNISPDLADDIVFAGMGGELIAKIIMRTQWLRDGNKRLILQPMSRADTLRLFLCENGFHIQQEKACISSGKSYSVMLCVYDGIKRNCSDIFKYTGLLENDNSQEAKRYIYVINDKLKKKLKGFDQNSEEYKNLYQTVSHLDLLSEGATL